MTGAEAIAIGAADQGVSLVASGDGSTSLEGVLAAATSRGMQVERSASARLALLTAVGASHAGARAIAVLPGLEGAADALHAAATAGCFGALLAVAVDDPGLAHRATRSDSRALARALEVPCVEPADPRECVEHVAAALELSERWGTPVVLRVTARLLAEWRAVASGAAGAARVEGLRRDRPRHVLIPEHAPALAARLKERLGQLAAEGVESPLNRVELRSSALGIVTSGPAYHHVREALPEASVLKLGLSGPLPSELVRDFARAVERVAVVEELDPVLESELRAAGIPCRGKDALPRDGELSPDLVARAFGAAARPRRSRPEVEPRPPEACPGCPRRALFQALKRLHVGVVADAACATCGAHPPQAVVDTSLVDGAAPALARGAAAVLGGRVRGRLVAVVTAETFLRAGVLGLGDAAAAGGTVVVLDDDTLPLGNGRPDLAAVARAFGAARVREVKAAELDACTSALRDELAAPGVSVVVVRDRCPAGAVGPRRTIAAERCSRCGACLRLGCPAIAEGPEAMAIDAGLCAGCGLCAQTCRAGAIGRREAEA